MPPAIQSQTGPPLNNLSDAFKQKSEDKSPTLGQYALAAGGGFTATALASIVFSTKMPFNSTLGTVAIAGVLGAVAGAGLLKLLD